MLPPSVWAGADLHPIRFKTPPLEARKRGLPAAPRAGLCRTPSVKKGRPRAIDPLGVQSAPFGPSPESPPHSTVSVIGFRVHSTSVPSSPSERSWMAGPGVVSELAAGGLLTLAGSWPLYFGPGAGPGHEPMVLSAAVPISALFVVLGAILVIVGLVRAARRFVFRRTPRYMPKVAPSGLVVGVSVVGLVLMILLSQGVIQGWYFAPTGTEQVRVICAAPPSGEFPIPYGFPPGATVHLTWVSANATPVRVWATQSPPNGYPDYSWTYQMDGASGQTNLTGTGGPFSISASSLSPCTEDWNVTVSWTYSAW